MKGVEHARRRETRHARPANLPAPVEQNAPLARNADEDETSARLQAHATIRRARIA